MNKKLTKMLFRVLPAIGIFPFIKCDDQSSGFCWVNTHRDFVIEKIKNGMSTEELRELDNEVCKWNQRSIPKAWTETVSLVFLM